MKRLIPLATLTLLLSTIAVHPQSFEVYGPPPSDILPPPEADGPPPRRMVCIIDTPFPDHQEHCATHPGYPGSPCRCAGSLFEGVREVLD